MLTAESRQFEFHYTALSFVAPARVKFKYQLEGFDKEWLEAGPRRTAYYMNLPAGEYRFKVIACNNDGVWNETGASFAFKLPTKFYRTYPFYVAVAATTLAFGLLMYRLRVKRLKGLTEELKQAVAIQSRRIAELEAELVKSQEEKAKSDAST